jgi:hypothetical protein
MTNQLPDTPEPTMVALVSGILNDAQVLIKQELALAKRNVLDELSKAKEAAFCLGVSLGLGTVGCVLLALMLAHLLHAALAERVPLWGCYGIVGAALVILGGGLFFWGKKRAGKVHLMPEQTVAHMKDNVAWIKNLT